MPSPVIRIGATTIGALAVAGLTALTAAPARAGDLGGAYPPPVEYDGRDYYTPPQRDVLPPSGSYKDDPLPPPPRPRYSEAPRRPACVSRAEVEHRLVVEGWRDFSDPERRGELGIFKARRPNGRLYELSVDRCSGEIVDAHPLDRGVYGPYAYYRPAPYYGWERRHWGRRYW